MVVASSGIERETTQALERVEVVPLLPHRLPHLDPLVATRHLP